jgi:hypothetical protein
MPWPSPPYIVRDYVVGVRAGHRRIVILETPGSWQEPQDTMGSAGPGRTPEGRLRKALQVALQVTVKKSCFLDSIAVFPGGSGLQPSGSCLRASSRHANKEKVYEIDFVGSLVRIYVSIY